MYPTPTGDACSLNREFELIQYTCELWRVSWPFPPLFFSLNYALTPTAEAPESLHGPAVRIVKEKPLSLVCCVYSGHEKWENQRERIILHSVGVIYTLLRWVYRFGRKGEFWGGIVKGESEIALIAFSKEQLQRNWGRLAASGKSMMGNSFRYCWNLCLKISLNFHPFVPWFLCCFDFCVLPLPLSSSFFFNFQWGLKWERLGCAHWCSNEVALMMS